jgi:uncharacterized membrane protein YqjE
MKAASHRPSNRRPLFGVVLDLIRQAREALLAGAQASLDRWAAELHQERRRLLGVLAWAAAAVFAGAMAVFLATLLIIGLAPPSARVAVLAVLTGLYLLLFVGLALSLRRRLRQHPVDLPVTGNLLAAGQLLGSAARAVREHGGAAPPRERGGR